MAVAAKSTTERDFQIVERGEDNKNGHPQFYYRTLRGTERSNNSLNRLSILSENQWNYPEPENGCGPTAMLNILVWYEKYGLIKPFNQHADNERYKRKLFVEIDRRIAAIKGIDRSQVAGISNVDIAMTMDSLVQENSNGAIRIHTETFNAPIKLQDLLNSMQNFRSGYLTVTPKDHDTGQMGIKHAVTLIRVDRAGYVTLANWGQLYRGLLKQRPDGQWFIPQDPTHMELKVHEMTRFIPFRPIAAEDR